MTTLLVMAVGQSDVQLVVGNQRQKIDGNICGILHDAIREREWTVIAAPMGRSRDLARTLPDGVLKLCTPKLDALLGHFGPEIPSSALIFETDRQGDRDPRMSGTVVESQLRERGVNQVSRVAFLTGSEQQEDLSTDVDAVVRREVVTRLSDAVERALRSLEAGDKVFVAVTGGLAAANEVITELVRLHAACGPSVTALEVPDGDRNQQVDIAVEEKFHPASGIRARWHALSLIERGNLLGAWGAASHLDGQPGQEWVQVVRWLGDFAASLPIAAECDFETLKHPRMAVRAALRVELALRAGDIPRAVHGTVAFFEAALWDALNERVERSTDPKRWRYFRIRNGAAPSGDKLLRQGDRSDEERTRPFELKDTIDGVDWYWIHEGDGGPAARLAKHFLQRSGLLAFDKALGSDLRRLRNDVAHNEPTPELMDDAGNKMRAAQLWSDGDTFLSQPLVQAVMSELQVTSPADLVADLLAEVRRRMVTINA